MSDASERPTIALFVSELEAAYQGVIWESVAAVAQAHDANLVTVAGGLLHGSPFINFELQRNIAYDLLNPEYLTGIVMVTTAIGNFVSQEELRAFCARYAAVPMVTVGNALPGISSIEVDSAPGMQQLMEHLIVEHGYRRIAFVRGPEGHPEADLRYQIYRTVLEEQGIPFDPQLVGPGDFVNSEPALELFLDERNVEFDALVTANDNMALRALEYLRTRRSSDSRGLKVPQDVAVVGFDNVQMASYAIPPLTTVRQPIVELGTRSAEMLFAILDGEVPPGQRIMLPTELVIRRSCGCLQAGKARPEPAVARLLTAPPQEDPAGTLHENLEDVQALVLAFVAGLKLEVTASEVGRLIDSFFSELESQEEVTADVPSEANFAVTLETMLYQTVLQGGPLADWTKLLSSLRRAMLPLLQEDMALLLRAEDILEQGYLVIDAVTERARALQESRTEQRIGILREVEQALITTFDLAQLMEVLAQQLPRLDIPSCFVSRYEAWNETAGTGTRDQVSDYGVFPERSQLALAYRDGETITPQPATGETLVYPTRDFFHLDLLPAERAYSLILHPLFFREEQLGFVFFEAGPYDGDIYQVLRQRLSSAMRGALLTEQLERRALQLQTAAEVSRASSAVLDPDELIQQAVNLVRERFDLYYVGLFLLEGAVGREQGPWAVLQAGTGEAGRKMLAAGHRLQVGGSSMIGQCVATGEARIALDVGAAAVRFDNPVLPETRSELALPLISRGETLGALTIQSRAPAAFSSQDIDTLQTMADQLANALANARLVEDLAREQFYMQVLMDSVPDHVYFKDRESRFLRTSRSHARRFGLDDPAEMVGKTDFDFFTDEHARPAYEDEQRIIATGEPIINLEERETREGEADTWVSTTKLPLRNERGQIVGTFGVSRDITERKRAEAQLAAERNLLHTMIDNLPDYIYVKDRQSRFVINNRAHLRVLGVESQEEVSGKTDFDFFPPELAERYYADDQEVMSTDQARYNYEEPVEDQTTGEQLWASSSKIPMHDEQGNVTGFVGLTRDITALHRAQEALERRNVQLRTAAEVSETALGITQRQELLQRVVDLVKERLDLYYVGVFLNEPEPDAYGRRWTRLQAGTGEAGRQMVAQEHRLDIGGTSMIGWSVAHKEPRITQDVGGEAVHRPHPLLPETRSEMALPLLTRGQEVIGALTIQSAAVEAFSREDVTVLQTIADQLAAALENAALVERMQSALNELQAVQRRYQVRVWSQYLEQPGAVAYEVTRPDVTPLDDEVRAALTQQALARATRAFPEAATPGLSPDAMVGEAAGPEGERAVVLPVTHRSGVPIGALGVHAEDEKEWLDEELMLIEAVAEQLGLAAENLRLLDETQRRVATEQLTREITADMRQSLDVEQVLRAAVRGFAEAFNVAEVNIRLLTDGTGASQNADAPVEGE